MKKTLYISIPLLLVALVMLGFQVVKGASEGPNVGTSWLSSSLFGTFNWTTESNADVSDNNYATWTGDTQYSYYLVGLGYNFAIPTGATINGIVVDIERNALTGSDSYKDARVRLLKAAVVGTTDKANTVDSWPINTDATASYGSSSDLWGETWTATDINSAEFGVALSVECITIGDACETFGYDARVDSMQITVHYTEASGTATTSSVQIRNGSIRQTGGSVKIN